jgi:hypothetical protein
MSEYPNVGACGGVNEPVFEIMPPWWFDNFKQSYAIGSQGDRAGDISVEKGYLWGAGLSVRKSAWQQLLRDGFSQLLVDRTGKAQTTGGDAELTFALRLAGWQLWYDPRLRLRHFLPANRLEWGYLVGLHRNIGASSVWLDLYNEALNSSPRNPSECLKRVWGGKMFATAVKLCFYVSKRLLSSFIPSEGNPIVLELNVRLGRLSELLRLRKHSTHLLGPAGTELFLRSAHLSRPAVDSIVRRDFET